MQGLILRPWRNNWFVIAVAVVSMIPVAVVRFLPTYDYPHWVYQANIIAHFSDFQGWYTLSWMPVPNLGSTIPLLFLTPLFGAELSTKILVAIYACSMVISFAYLVRGITRLPTSTELFGSVLVYNYFFYNGFLSYIIGFPILLATLGMILRISSQPSRRDLAILSILSVLAYLCHLFVWIPIVLYILVTVFVLRIHRPILLISQIFPALFLFLYALQRGKDISTQYYNSLPNKIFSILSPVLPIQRVDPFQPPIPILFLNIIVISIIALLFIRNLPSKPLSRHRYAFLYLFAGLLFVAAVLPFTWFSGMGAVDQRFAFTAYIALLVALSAAKASRSSYLLATLFSVLLLSAHTINFIASDNQMRMVHKAIQIRPQSASVFVAALRHPPVFGECAPENVMNTGNGIFALQWFPLYDAVERGGIVASSFDTAALRPNHSASYPLMFGQFQTEAERKTLLIDSDRMKDTYDYLFLFGCPEDVHSVEDKLVSRFNLLDNGTYYAIIKLSNR